MKAREAFPQWRWSKYILERQVVRDQEAIVSSHPEISVKDYSRLITVIIQGHNGTGYTTQTRASYRCHRHTMYWTIFLFYTYNFDVQRMSSEFGIICCIQLKSDYLRARSAGWNGCWLDPAGADERKNSVIIGETYSNAFAQCMGGISSCQRNS